MPQQFSSDGAQKTLCVLLGNKAAEGLKVLIETKHLYQKIDIQPDEMATALHKQILVLQQDIFAKWLNEELPKQRFVLEPQLTTAATIEALTQPLILKLPQPSIFCKLCGRREAFAP